MRKVDLITEMFCIIKASALIIQEYRGRGNNSKRLFSVFTTAHSTILNERDHHEDG